MQVHQFNGIDYVMEEAIRGDYALIKAHKADKQGNLIFRFGGVHIVLVQSFVKKAINHEIPR